MVTNDTAKAISCAKETVCCAICNVTIGLTCNTANACVAVDTSVAEALGDDTTNVSGAFLCGDVVAGNTTDVHTVVSYCVVACVEPWQTLSVNFVQVATLVDCAVVDTSHTAKVTEVVDTTKVGCCVASCTNATIVEAMFDCAVVNCCNTATANNCTNVHAVEAVTYCCGCVVCTNDTACTGNGISAILGKRIATCTNNAQNGVDTIFVAVGYCATCVPVDFGTFGCDVGDCAIVVVCNYTATTNCCFDVANNFQVFDLTIFANLVENTCVACLESDCVALAIQCAVECCSRVGFANVGGVGDICNQLANVVVSRASICKCVQCLRAGNFEWTSACAFALQNFAVNSYACFECFVKVELYCASACCVPTKHFVATFHLWSGGLGTFVDGLSGNCQAFDTGIKCYCNFVLFLWWVLVASNQSHGHSQQKHQKTNC